jgi:hypothetical protein
MPKRAERKSPISTSSCIYLFSGLGALAAAHLLGLQVLVEKVQRRLVSLGTTHDGEHPFTSVIMRRLGNADSRARGLPDLRDLAAGAANDASHHVRRDRDVLSLDLLAVLVVRGHTAVGSTTLTVGVGSALEAARCGTLAEVGAVAGASHASVVVVATAAVVHPALTQATLSAGLGAHNGVVEHGAGAALPVVDEAFADLPDGLLDALGAALDLNDTLGGLGKHLLLGHHADAGDVLDVLDLQTLTTDDRAHLVVGDEEFDGWK